MVVFILGCGQSYVSKTADFANRVKAVANPDELQAWATNLIAKSSATNGTLTGPLIPNKDIDVPKWTGLIYKQEGQPEFVTIKKNGPGDPDPYVEIVYGDGFGHLGILVGYPTLKCTNDNNFYYLAWKPGIYFCSGP